MATNIQTAKFSNCWRGQRSIPRGATYCKIEEVVTDGKITGPGRVLNKCQNHASVADADLFRVLKTEGYRKNQMLRGLMGDIDGDPTEEKLGLGEDVIDPEDGRTRREFKTGVLITTRYEGTGDSRVLHFKLSGGSLNAGQRTSVQRWADSKLTKLTGQGLNETMAVSGRFVLDE